MIYTMGLQLGDIFIEGSKSRWSGDIFVFNYRRWRIFSRTNFRFSGFSDSPGVTKISKCSLSFKVSITNT